MKKTHHLVNNKLVVVLFIISFIACQQNLRADSIKSVSEEGTELYIRSFRYLKDSPDSAYQIINKYYQEKRLEKDTIAQIKSLLALADIKKIKGNFGEAYDHTWDAQLLAESKKDSIQLAECHSILGMLYSVFNDEDQSLYHKEQALALKKRLFLQDKISLDKLSGAYFSIAVHYSRFKQYDKANTYLDTCIKLAEDEEKTPVYALTEKAYVAIQENKLHKAEKILTEISPFFLDNNKHYAIMIYSFWGDLRSKQNRPQEAINYFKQCLTSMDEHKVHTDIKPEVLEKLAQLYAKLGQSDQAYHYLSESKHISDKLFSAKNNSELLEIKNKYKETMLIKDRALAEQQTLLIEKKEQNFKLKATLGIIIFILTLCIFILINWTQKKKHTALERENEIKSELEKEQHQQLVKVKNKEITSYTLQLIDKERVIDELLAEVEQHLDKKRFISIRNASKDFNKNLWKEFNERFTMVNDVFYKHLLEQYPTLSPTELKHCALIKLNFNGKEMAQLLNISLSSVHLARHRLRKKLGLKREDNLAKVIAKI